MNNYSNIKILVCCHKPYKIPKNDIYLPIHVGKAKSDVTLNIQCDNESEVEDGSISELNSIFCEMTAMYWAWKNIRSKYPGIQYVGLCHYRRYFNANRTVLKDTLVYSAKVIRQICRLICGSCREQIICESIENIENFDDKKFTISDTKLEKIIRNNEIVYTKPVRLLTCNVRTFFEVIGRIYIELLETIVESDFPEYRQSLQDILNGNSIISANMLIIRVDYLDDYCNFIFNILKKHIKVVKERGICDYPETERIYSRVSGYLAELLTATYIKKNKTQLKCAEVGKFFISE